MCGRYTLTVRLEDLQDLLPGVELPDEIAPRYNVAPTQSMPIALNVEGRPVLTPARWGLIPHWAKDASIGSRMINARSETLSVKPSFREPFRKRRCLVPATGFYEWRKEPGQARKTPFLIRMPGGRPFVFAGLWDAWTSPEGPVRSFTIVTTSPNDVMAPIHDRMPVILPASTHAAWLDPAPRAPEELPALLVPFAGRLETVQVSTAVNNPKHDAPDCVEAIA